MVIQLHQSPLNLQEFCDFIQYVSNIESTFGKLKRVSELIHSLIEHAKRRSRTWFLQEEYHYNIIHREITRVISLLAKKTKRSRDGRRGVCSIVIR
jgi:hypothetical protein